MTNPIANFVASKQLLTTVGISAAAFLVALPIGAAVMPNNSVVEAQGPVTTVTRTVSDLGSCVEGTSSATKSTKTVTTAKHSAPAATQTSSNNSGSTAQVGRDGIAAAVTVGDVLSNNNVSVPVLSNNTTTVSPTVNLLSNNDGSSLLGLGLLGL